MTRKARCQIENDANIHLCFVCQKRFDRHVQLQSIDVTIVSDVRKDQQVLKCVTVWIIHIARFEHHHSLGLS